jgi:uncharacterized protein (TIRG00374 family)
VASGTKAKNAFALRRLPWKFVLAAGLLALVLWHAQFWELPDTFAKVKWSTIVFVLALNIPVVALWTVRSHLVLRRLGHRLPVGPLFLVTTLGNVAGILTPAGAGDLLRGVALKDKYGLSRESAAAAVLYERLYLPFLVVFSIVDALCVEALGLWAAPVVVLVGVAAAAGSGFLYAPASATVRSAMPSKWKDRLTRRSEWLLSLGDVDVVLKQLFTDVRLGLSFSSITALVYALTALQVWLIIDGLRGDVSIAQAWIAFAVASLTSLIALVPGGLGIWDATFPALLNGWGVDFLSATAAAVLLRGLQTLPLGLLALCCYLLLSRGAHADAKQDKTESAPASEYSG